MSMSVCLWLWLCLCDVRGVMHCRSHTHGLSQLAHQNIKAFAEAQRASIHDVDNAPGLWPGMVAGHRMVRHFALSC